jgi:hypothetical protein
LALNHPKEIFRDGVTISYARSGDFGRAFLMKHVRDHPPKQPGNHLTELRIGSDTAEELFQVLYTKLREDAAAESQNCRSKNSTKHRKRASNWFIDARDHLGGIPRIRRSPTYLASFP